MFYSLINEIHKLTAKHSFVIETRVMLKSEYINCKCNKMNGSKQIFSYESYLMVESFIRSTFFVVIISIF